MIRLIDANALLKSLKSGCENCSDANTNWCEHCCKINDFEDLIDNAPTVEVSENAVNCVLTMFGKCSYNETGCSDCEIKDKIRKALSERPQGKWIEENTETGALGIKYTWFKCSQCGWDSSLVIPNNFCPNCGADMRGGAE